MRRRFGAATFVFCALAPAAAFAHAHLVRANPAAGSTVAAPDVVRLEFSEGVVPRLCDIAISGADGKPIKAERPAGNGVSVSTAIKDRLKPGTYTVNWRAVSVDSHRTTGRFTFTVMP